MPQSPLEDSLYASIFNAGVLITGIGFFVDMFDYFLYNSARVVSLTDMGLSGDALTQAGINILNCGLFGVLLGGLFWGILGDKIGRKKAILGSVLLYSLGMIANGFVQSIPAYELNRFVTGLGMGGEVGVGATLVAEMMPVSKRAYALMLFTVIGMLGIVSAGFSVEYFHWRTCYIIGGILGLLLLLLRSVLYESRLFEKTVQSGIRRGFLRDLLGQKNNLTRWLLCVPLLGTNYLITGVIITLSPEIAKGTGVAGVMKANIALALYFSVAVIGDLFGAWLTERLKSRKKVIVLFMTVTAVLTFCILQPLHLSTTAFYLLCASCGLFNLWAITGTTVVELFPTQIRATAASSNINASRAMVIGMNLSLLVMKPLLGLIPGLLVIWASVFAFGLQFSPSLFSASGVCQKVMENPLHSTIGQQEHLSHILNSGRNREELFSALLAFFNRYSRCQLG